MVTRMPHFHYTWKWFTLGLRCIKKQWWKRQIPIDEQKQANKQKNG